MSASSVEPFLNPATIAGFSYTAKPLPYITEGVLTPYLKG